MTDVTNILQIRPWNETEKAQDKIINYETNTEKYARRRSYIKKYNLQIYK